jgi:acetylglutamate kinase
VTGELTPAARAGVLVEALPYILRFWGKIVVIKYGGNALVPADTPDAPGAALPEHVDALSSFAEDVVLMRSVGLLPVVVHGGGPQIGELMDRLGKVSEFRDGMRVTDAETLEIASMVLVGKINREIVSAMNRHGSLAVGLSGEDANMITATARDAALGFVGDVHVVDPTILHRLLAQGLIPVVATIAGDTKGQSYNVNADAVAGAIASALEAEKVIFLTDVEGLRADPADRNSLLHRVTVDDLDAMVASGTASGGMVPKVQACARAVREGVARAHILDGRVPHALLLEVFTDRGVGTMVSAHRSADEVSAHGLSEEGSPLDGPTGMAS